MFGIRTGLVVGVISVLLTLGVMFIRTMPDGKLHIVFCDVGQGDATYIRFPDGRDALIDGGPGAKVSNCLGSSMAFWDRWLDFVVITHPEKDHIAGLIDVITRYRVGRVFRSIPGTGTDVAKQLEQVMVENRIPQVMLAQGDTVRVGQVILRSAWPTRSYIAGRLGAQASIPPGQVLGTSLEGSNELSVVLHVQYGTFDLVLTGDADSAVDSQYLPAVYLADGDIDVLKVPHHGSRTGLSASSFAWLASRLNSSPTSIGVISVGKNSYGHPSPEIVDRLSSTGMSVVRTDTMGDIRITVDAGGWSVD